MQSGVLGFFLYISKWSTFDHLPSDQGSLTRGPSFPIPIYLMAESLKRVLKARKVEGAIKGVGPHEEMDP